MESFAINYTTVAIKWGGTHEDYFEIWDKLPNTREVGIFNSRLSIVTHDDIKTTVDPNDWLLIEYPGIYTRLTEEEFKKKLDECGMSYASRK